MARKGTSGERGATSSTDEGGLHWIVVTRSIVEAGGACEFTSQQHLRLHALYARSRDFAMYL